MTPDYPHLATRLFNVPLAIAPGKIEVIMAALADRFGLARLFRTNGKALTFDGDYEAGEPAGDRTFEVIDGIAVIPVQGTLVQKLGTLHPYSGMTGYDGIRANLATALGDDAVRAVVLDVDSPGGEVAGCFDLTDAIFASRGIKPLYAILTECAYSAAYALASACDRVIVPRTGGTGSVGVIVAHVDFSKALSDAGLTVTLITYGERKADGSEYRPLSDEAYTRIKADVDSVGELFVATVARNRGLTVAQVRGTQAATFLGAASVDNGFADAVMSPDAAFLALLDSLALSSVPQ
ncbi:signal peptide peptidase SppA [Paraburkholderia sp. HC6.4b]|uniref:S49 family peptidase n=1 Tax=unclassified Paraburkholderia TaxID=2615204 RepID=UPI0016105068|nr:MULTISPECIES: S49 family peptidase [unclassified Paraburkholderia]MBB5411692.1 signal peptide peptidase SppA [Paraburkholderia sp. HC6.4b]MBB5453279.1 signal peptide peptidase SppA [Paraburkholderia sp. Kb1A]